MNPISNRSQWTWALLLGIVVIATRGQHIATLQGLPDASWAAFFLFGMLIPLPAALFGLFALTWGLDAAALYADGGAAYCITPAYGFLLPAYAALWIAGRWFARRYQANGRGAMSASAAVVFGAALCEALSSGGFYFLSGRFDDPTIAEFSLRFVQYFPTNLMVTAGYIAATAVVYFTGKTLVQNGRALKRT